MVNVQKLIILKEISQWLITKYMGKINSLARCFFVKSLGTMAFIISIVAIGALTSCDNEETNEQQSYDMVYANVEGQYIGTFTDNPHGGEPKYSGNIFIKLLSNNLYSIEGTCDDIDLSIYVDGIELPYRPYHGDQIRFHMNPPDLDEYYWYMYSGYMWLSNMEMVISFIYHGEYPFSKTYHFKGKKVN